MATAAVTFIQSNVVPRQPNLRVRGRTSCIVYCNNGSRETGDGQQNEAVDMAKLLGLVLQTDESKALLKDLDEAVQRVENAKRELKELDQQRPEEKMASKFDQEMESQQRLVRLNPATHMFIFLCRLTSVRGSSLQQRRRLMQLRLLWTLFELRSRESGSLQM